MIQITTLARSGAALALVAAGWMACDWRHQASATAEALARSETNRESERLASRNMTRVSDELTRSRLASVRAGADMRERLRIAAEAARASQPSGTACGNDDAAPAIGVVPDSVRERLAGLGDEAEAVSDRLRACQAAVSLVASPLSKSEPPGK